MGVFKRGPSAQEVAAALIQNGKNAERNDSGTGDDHLDTSPEGHHAPDGEGQRWRIGDPRTDR